MPLNIRTSATPGADYRAESIDPGVALGGAGALPVYAPPVDPVVLRRWCLARPQAVEEFPFRPNVSVFKVGGKIFAISDLDARPLKVSVKCEPDLAVQLRATYPAVAPGYHLNKRHWNTITLDGSLPDAAVFDMIEDSYDLVVAGLSEATRRRLGLKSEPAV
jgi:predicted DNA-binding protein (MmcQ/YjbR family)